MNEDNIQGMIGQAQSAAGMPSVEGTTSTLGMGFGAEQALSVFGQPKKAESSPLESQYQTVLGMARKAASERKAAFSAGLGTNGTGRQPAVGQVAASPVWNANPSAQSVPQPAANPSARSAPAPAVAPSPLPQIVNRRGMFGTESKPSYAYNGMSVMLPDGIDLNDSKAVREAMQTENDYLDMIYGNNEEDL